MLGWPKCKSTTQLHVWCNVISYKDCGFEIGRLQIATLILFLQDDVFEDSIVDFFEIADANKDGVLEYDELYAVR